MQSTKDWKGHIFILESLFANLWSICGKWISQITILMNILHLNVMSHWSLFCSIERNQIRVVECHQNNSKALLLVFCYPEFLFKWHMQFHTARNLYCFQDRLGRGPQITIALQEIASLEHLILKAYKTVQLFPCRQMHSTFFISLLMPFLVKELERRK